MYARPNVRTWAGLWPERQTIALTKKRGIMYIPQNGAKENLK